MNPLITLAEWSTRLTKGRISSRELTEIMLERAQRHFASGGHAFIELDEEGARAAAEAADHRLSLGRRISSLDGLPVSIKDLFDVAGQVTRAGSRVLEGEPAAADDAPVVASLREAGAVFMGRTNMTEFAYSGLGLNPHFGTPLSPRGKGVIAGGSSSGAAVSVALGMSVVALGSDTGGSVRIPAAFCGVTGFKPTARRLALEGMVPLAPSLDSIGPLAPSVACCAQVDALLTGAGPWCDAGLPLRDRRLFVTADHVLEDLDADVAEAFDWALARLAEQGVEIVEFRFPELQRLPEINAAGGIAAAESWHWHRERLLAGSGHYDPRVAQRIERGGRLSTRDYTELLLERAGLKARAAEVLRGADAWLMPTVSVSPPRLADILDEDAYHRINARVLANPSVVNFIDGCALSIPLPKHPGIALGVCGLGGQDAGILQLGAAMERCLG
ncbi:amidase [Pseudomonas tohonis]|uniref:Amidase n=1 Tax=Pseudomonas tohonis TaxID=2725477 RepID=A0A6J4E5J6_9PSED|nr:amidase [Pseudomonas tohonis]BCG25127.1 amidase [Pseudomonas tohonis]GJN54269.1 amidase [Pseudomonas tohonis]